MQPGFTSEFFVANRRRLRTLYGKNSPIIITANGLLQRSGDNSFSFQQDPNFWYLTGINEPDFILVIYKDQEYLIAPGRSEVQDIFDGSVDWKELKHVSGIKQILSKDDGWAFLRPLLKKAKGVATVQPLPAYIEQVGLYTNPARSALISRAQDVNPKLQIDDLRPQLAELRVVKQAPEIAAIKSAVEITCQAFLVVQQRSYDYEYQLEADLTQLYRAAGAAGHGYNPIVAGGLNACTLHYGHNSTRLRKGRLVLVDSGAMVGQYSADITRTWPVGKATSRQRAVLEAVNEALEFGLSQLTYDKSFYEAEQKIRGFVGQKLKELKLAKRVSKDTIHQYYPHSPHYLGLDVHDAGDYKAALKPGMVLTLEPGIYIPEEFIGVRIEENILMTEKGPEVLSGSLPRLLQ